MGKVKKIFIFIVILAVVATAAIFGIKYYLDQQSHEAELEALYNGALEEIESLEYTNEVLSNPPKVKITVKTLQERVAPASELITYKYYYTDVGTYEKTQPIFDMEFSFMTDKSVYTYSGVISAGIDVDDIKFMVSDTEGDEKIVVTMPEPKIIAHELDEKSFQSYDVQNSMFTSSDLNEFAGFQSELKTTEEEKLSANTEFWDSVKKNAEDVINGLLTADENINEYEIEYRWAE